MSRENYFYTTRGTPVGKVENWSALSSWFQKTKLDSDQQKDPVALIDALIENDTDQTEFEQLLQWLTILFCTKKGEKLTDTVPKKAVGRLFEERSLTMRCLEVGQDGTYEKSSDSERRRYNAILQFNRCLIGRDDMPALMNYFGVDGTGANQTHFRPLMEMILKTIQPELKKN